MFLVEDSGGITRGLPRLSGSLAVELVSGVEQAVYRLADVDSVFLFPWQPKAWCMVHLQVVERRGRADFESWCKRSRREPQMG